MAITNIWWEGGGYDLHVLADETAGPLNDRLLFTREDADGNVTVHFASARSAPPDILAKPDDVDVEFFGEFRLAIGPQPAGWRRGYGVEVNTTTGTIKVDRPPLAARRLYNFLIKAEVKDTADNSKPQNIRIRVLVHESIKKIWLTPRKLIVRSGATNQQFTVLAEFEDGTYSGTYGDITGRTDLGFTSSNAGVASVDVATGIVTYVADGTAQITVTGTPPLPEGSDTADVLARPSLAVARGIETVRRLGFIQFDQKTNILFLPDGFTAGERQIFNDIVDLIVESLQKNKFTYPYNLLKDSINYWRLVDADFLASEEEGVSVLSEVSIVRRKDLHARRLPFPRDPGAATAWELENLIFKVGFPVPADWDQDLASKLTDWRMLYEIPHNPPISNAVFLEWHALHTRKLLNERCTVLGFAIDEHPRADQGWWDRSLKLDPRRLADSEFQAMINMLGGTIPSIKGTTWTTGKDKGLVCVICRSRLVAGERTETGLASSLADDLEQPVEVAPAPRRGLDLQTTAPLVPLHPMVPVTVAHECAHAFGLKDEYGANLNFPAHLHASIADSGNVQPAQEVRSQYFAIDPSRIKWNWPRLTAAGRLTAKPKKSGAVFEIELEPGHDLPFSLHNAVMLRKKDFVVVPPATAFSGWCRVTQKLESPTRVVIQPAAGVIIDPDDFDIGSALVRPKLGTPATTLRELGLVAPKIATWMSATSLPLNRKAPATCSPANDHTSIMTPVNLPGGLSPTQPMNKTTIVGLYDGGARFDCDVFHPAGVCLMRRQGDQSAGFCHVCRYLIVDRVDCTKHLELDARYGADYPEA